MSSDAVVVRKGVWWGYLPPYLGAGQLPCCCRCRRSGSDRRSDCRQGSPPELSALLSLFSSLAAVARGSCSQLHKMQTRVVIFAGSRARAGQDPPPQRRADTTRSRSRSAPRGQDLRSLSGDSVPSVPTVPVSPGWSTSCFTSRLVFGLFPCFLPCGGLLS